MPRTDISNSDDILDSRQIIERLDDLRSELESHHEKWKELDEVKNTMEFDDWIAANDTLQIFMGEACVDFDDELQEYVGLKDFAANAESVAGEWNHGETLIREDHFEECCQQLVADIGDLPNELPSYIVIDWEATAKNIRQDYSEAEWNGVTYLVRS